MQMPDLYSYVDQFSGIRVLCVGDIMLDNFVYGKTNRLSPEAPVPVLLEQQRRSMLGGVGNVVANLSALGCKTAIAGIVGEDEEGQVVRACLHEYAADDTALFSLEGYQTAVKTRFVAGRQHLLRVDKEERLNAPETLLGQILTSVEAVLSQTDIVLISDYGKGLIDERLTPEVIKLCNREEVPVIVDPKRTDYTIYASATLVKPNRKEFEGVTGRHFEPSAPDFIEVATQAGREVCEKYHVGNLLVTLSEYGMLYIPGDATTKPALIPTEAKEVFDVSGAGDTSLATLGAALAVGAPMKHAIKIANAAAGIVVGKLGTACVSGAELKQKLTNKEEKSVLTADEAVQLIAKLRQKGYTIGFTNGCFDILHPGHLASFKRARALCDVLFVGLNSDASVQRLKGPTRPINTQDDRAAMLTALRSVDYVVIFDEDSALPLLEKLRPDVIAKEGYPLDKWRGGRFVQSYGGQAVVLPRMDGFSTTTIIEKINK